MMSSPNPHAANAGSVPTVISLPTLAELIRKGELDAYRAWPSQANRFGAEHDYAHAVVCPACGTQRVLRAFVRGAENRAFAVCIHGHAEEL